MPKRTGTWYAPRAKKMARYTPYNKYSRARPSKFKAQGSLNSKRFSVKPTRFPRIAKSAGYAKYAQVRTFTNMVFESLDLTPGTGVLANEFRSNSLAFYPKLSFFAGFEQMMVLYEMCKPISMTVRARICKINTSGVVGGRDVASINYSATPDQTGGPQGAGAIVNAGSMPSPGLFDFMEVRSCVDYDGKEGKGGAVPYDFVDYVNAGNTALGYINGKYLKTVAQFEPRQYVDNSTQFNSGQPLLGRTQFYPQHSFLTYNAQTQSWAPSVTEPKFGGVNLFATSYDAVSNGYNGKLGDNNPCLTIQYYVDLKVAFKGKIKNKDVTDIDQIVS